MNTLRYRVAGIPDFTRAEACTSHLPNRESMMNSFKWGRYKPLSGMKTDEIQEAIKGWGKVTCEYHTKDIPGLSVSERRRFNRVLMASAFAPYLQQKGNDVWATWEFKHIPRSTIIFTIMRYAEELTPNTREILLKIRWKKVNATAVLVGIPLSLQTRGISGHHVLRPLHHFKEGFEEGQKGLSLLQRIMDKKSDKRPRTVMSSLVRQLGSIDQERAGVDEELLKEAPWEYFGGTV